MEEAIKQLTMGLSYEAQLLLGYILTFTILFICGARKRSFYIRLWLGLFYGIFAYGLLHGCNFLFGDGLVAGIIYIIALGFTFILVLG